MRERSKNAGDANTEQVLSRRQMLGRTAVGAAAVALTVTGVGAPTAGAAEVTPLDLPEVNMEAVLKAAQIDPRRADTALTPGSKDSVLLVEQALQAKGHLSGTYLDGHFGTSTITAYAAYQKSLGYSGLDASGLPGPTSLQKLAEGRFTVTNLVRAGARVTFRSRTVNERTKAMLLAAEGLMGRTLGITQGSYNPGGVGASAGTHDGGGALDLSVSGMSAATIQNVLLNLRKVGFAAWYRTTAQGFTPHIHAIAINDPDLAPGARNQAGDYYLGKNGLANRGPDDGPRITIVTWEEYQRA